MIHWLRLKLIAGLLALVPLAVTFWVVKGLITWLDGIIGKHLVRYLPEIAKVPGLGLVALVLLLLLTGTLVRSYIGRKMFGTYDSILTRLPFARMIYVSVKQLVAILSPDDDNPYRQVALIEYPRKGIYAMVFVTARGTGEIRQKIKAEVASVFLPTTPNPTSGFLLVVPRDQIIPLSMSIEDATKYIISAGIVQPEDRKPAGVPQLDSGQVQSLTGVAPGRDEPHG